MTQTQHVDIVDAMIDLANETGPYATITRGSLPSGEGITCETSDGTPTATFLSRNEVYQVPIVFNAKHANLQTALSALSTIMVSLTHLSEYPEAAGWEMVQVMSNTPPTIVGRDEINLWVVGCSVIVEYYVRGE